MSYNATISFKTVELSGLYHFFQKLKAETAKKINAIAVDEFLYMPSVRYEHLYKDTHSVVQNDADEAWAKGIFTHRFFYLAEYNLLGVFGVPNDVQQVFDANIYFQNSCDQDYEFETWSGVPVFEQVAEKWKNATDEEVRRKYTEEDDGSWDEEVPFDYDYFRRKYAYDEIWDMCEEYLFNEDSVVYVSMFGYYDFQPIIKFVKKCREEYKKFCNIDEEG